jgi:hypothetical protein
MNTFILFMTFLTLLWYAWETKKIREIEQKPIIDLYYRPKTADHQEYLRLRNSGKGTAYNIKVERIKSQDNKKIFEFYFNGPNSILINNTEQTLSIQAKEGDSNWIDRIALNRFLSYIKQQASEKKSKVAIIVSYKNFLRGIFRRTFYIYSPSHLDSEQIYKNEFEVELFK